MKTHPYALILGLGIGIMVLAALRHPLFAVFAAIVAVLGFDLAFKSRKKIDHKKDNEE